MNKSLLYCLIAIALFSTYEIVGKMLGPHVPAVSMTAIRFFIGGLLLLPFALKEKKMKVPYGGKTLSKIIIVGILNVSISMVLLQLSVFYSKAVLAAIIFSVNPVFVGIFSLFFEKEKISKFNIFGLSIGLLGLVVISIAEKNLFTGSTNMLLGILFGILSAIVFGAYTVLSKIYVNEIGSFKLTSFSFISGSVILFIVSKLLGLEMSFDFNISNLVALGYLSVIITGIGYYLYFDGLKTISTAKGAMFFYLKPVIAGVLAFFFLKETLTIFQVLGFLIVLVGVNLERILKSLQNKVVN
jgi:drug/metabolite transporter (DMT)-like permease